MSTALQLSVPELKNFLEEHKEIKLVAPEKLLSPSGLQTHCYELDSYLFWKGLPVSAVSLFYGSNGLGATRLWLQTAAPLMKAGQWVAWMNSEHCELTPWYFQQKQIPLSRLLLISAPKQQKEWFWALEETLSLSLFELIGFSVDPWKIHHTQLLKLHQLTRRYKTAVVLLSQKSQYMISPFYSLALRFETHKIIIERARHRPTPKELTRRQLYADFMPQLAKGRKALRG